MSRKKKKHRSLYENRDGLHAAWSTMPDDFLKERYQKAKRQQKLWASPPLWFLIPAMTVYGIIGWGDFFVSEYNQFTESNMNTVGMFYPIWFAFCSIFLSEKEPKKLWRSPVVFAFGAGCYIGLTETVSALAPFMLIYLLIAAAALVPIVGDLAYLRSLPNFPFDARRQSIDFSGMTREQMLRNLEASVHGNILEGKGQEVLTAEDPEAAANPPENTEDYLQQHKMVYRNKS